MSALIMGQLLLGFLAVASILVNLLFVRLKRHYQCQMEIPTALPALLFWLPLGMAVVVIVALALAESGLLSYGASQDLNGVSRFVIGTCLLIFADLCVALAGIALKEVVKMANTADNK